MTQTRILELGSDDRPDEFRWAEVALVVGAALAVSAMVAGALWLGWWVCQYGGATLRLAGV